MIEYGGSLEYLLNEKLPPEDMAYSHSLDISGSVYRRMKELGISKSELAERMGVSPAQITKIIKGNQNMTLKTIAKLEYALDMNMSYGFDDPKPFSNDDGNVVHFPTPAPHALES